MKWLKTSDQNTLYSFILDPFLLVLAGMFIVWLAKRKKTVLILSMLLLIGFWLIAGVGFYADNLNMPFLGEAGQGNHFMWNSGIELLGFKPILDTGQPTYADFFSGWNILALFIFVVLYPLFLYVGVKLGYRFFAKKPH